MEYWLYIWLSATEPTRLDYGSIIPMTTEQCDAALEAHEKEFPHVNYECRKD
jgi:hypothetical protein